MWHKVIFSWSLTGFNSEISFSLTDRHNKVQEPVVPYYLLEAGRENSWEREFMTFSRILVLWGMQTATSKIWTRVPVSISYGDNHYIITACAYVCMCMYICEYMYVYGCVEVPVV